MVVHSALGKIHAAEAMAMRPWHGADAPAVYTTAEEEFDAAHQGLALIDRSWLGRIEVSGADRTDLLHRLSTNDLLRAKSGDVVETVFTNDKGRIIDDVRCLFRGDAILLLTSPSNEAAVSSWIEKYTIMEDVTARDVSPLTSLLTLIGPQVKSYVARMTGMELASGRIENWTFAGIHTEILYGHDHNAEMVDFILDADHAGALWRALTQGEGRNPVTRMGTDAYDAFRIAKGMPSIGAELSDAFNPYEAGLRHAISFTKGCYIGQEVIARLETYRKIRKEMWGIRIEPLAVPATAPAPVTRNGEIVGMVTSVSDVVIRGKQPGIAIVKKGSVSADETVGVLLTGHELRGQIRSFPMAF